MARHQGVKHTNQSKEIEVLILSDIHVGFDRKGGTTPASQETMRSYLLQSFGHVVDTSDEGVMVILGDLFDSFAVSERDLLATYHILMRWISRNRKLVLVAGNHDWSPKGDRVSSFQLLCEILEYSHGNQIVQVIPINEWAQIEPGVVAVAHCANQELFDTALTAAMVTKPTYLLVHCNYDNKFAAQTDHSLNISRDKAREIVDAGTKLVFAHEHIARSDMAGNVIVLGNQWPTSIIDCMGNDKKFAHTLGPTFTDDLVFHKFETWSAAHDDFGYCELDWRLAGTKDMCAGFIRVVGSATSSEASDVINAIAAFRQRSNAFVITNAVNVEGVLQAEELPENFEAAKKFDVMDYIKQHLEVDEMAVVEGLLR